MMLFLVTIWCCLPACYGSSVVQQPQKRHKSETIVETEDENGSGSESQKMGQKQEERVTTKVIKVFL